MEANKNYPQAEEICENLGGRLPFIPTASKRDLFKQIGASMVVLP